MRCRPSLVRGRAAQVNPGGFTTPARRPSVPHRTAGCGKSSLRPLMAGSRSSQVSKWSGELSTKYWNRCPFRVESADTARKPGNGPTARFLAPPLPDVPPSPKNAATGRLDLLAAVWLSGCWSGRAVKGGGGGWRGPQRSEDTGHPRKAQRPLTDLERPTLPAGVKERRAAGPYALHP